MIESVDDVSDNFLITLAKETLKGLKKKNISKKQQNNLLDQLNEYNSILEERGSERINLNKIL